MIVIVCIVYIHSGLVNTCVIVLDLMVHSPCSGGQCLPWLIPGGLQYLCIPSHMHRVVLSSHSVWGHIELMLVRMCCCVTVPLEISHAIESLSHGTDSMSLFCKGTVDTKVGN